MTTKKFEGYIPKELIESIKNKRCILFVGAGLSANVIRSNSKGLPTWYGLLEELLNYGTQNNLIFSRNEKDIEEMIHKGNLIMAAQELQEVLSRKDFNDFCNSIFKDKNVSPTKTHLLLPSIPFRSILTSNYDTLIEGAYTVYNKGIIPTKFTQDDLAHISSPLRSDEFYIFKIHGDIERPNTMILGSRDYNKLLFKTPEYRQFLEVLFSAYTFLFVGFGSTDPDLDNTLDKLSSLFDRTIDKHYILLPENKFNFTERKRLLLDKRLEIIEYQKDENHTQVDTFFEVLSSHFQSKKPIEKQSKKYDIFLSYSSQDKNISKKINEILSNQGFRIWNPKDIVITLDWQDTFEIALNECRFLIFIISENYVKSNWLEKELSIGLLKQLEGKIKVMPIVMSNMRSENLPNSLSSILYLRLDEEFSEEDLMPIIKYLNTDLERL